MSLCHNTLGLTTLFGAAFPRYDPAVLQFYHSGDAVEHSAAGPRTGSISVNGRLLLLLQDGAMTRFLLFAAALGAALLTLPAQARTPGGSAPPIGEPAAAALQHMRGLDQRVATIGHRLAIGARDLCTEPAFLAGVVLHDLGQYPPELRPVAAAAFGLSDAPGVLALAEDGPAARAGLRLDDLVVAVDGAALGAPPDPARASFAGTERMLDLLESALGDGRATFAVLRAGTATRVEVAAQPGCPTRFQLMPSGRLNAKADGRYVQVTTAIADYVANDDELAWVLAHEFAHNLLRHRARLRAAGVPRGFLRQLGRNARRVRDTETEADRLSVYLMERAGYDAGAALRFWSRYGPSRPSFFDSPTHPRWRDRVTVLTEEIARLRTLKAAGRPLVPALLTGDVASAP